MVYIIADINLNDSSAAQELNKTIDEYNRMIVDNWNKTVKETDEILIFGKIGNKPIESLKNIIQSLNGQLYLMDYNSNKNYKIETWKKIGIDYIINCSIFDSIGDDKFCIPIAEQIDNYLTTVKYLCLTEKHKMDTIFKNNCLNISVKNWDYTPIPLKELPKIIERMSEFDTMEGQ